MIVFKLYILTPHDAEYRQEEIKAQIIADKHLKSSSRNNTNWKSTYVEQRDQNELSSKNYGNCGSGRYWKIHISQILTSVERRNSDFPSSQKLVHSIADQAIKPVAAAMAPATSVAQGIYQRGIDVHWLHRCLVTLHSITNLQ